MKYRFSRDVAVYGGTDFLLKIAQFAALPLITSALSLADFGTLSLLQVLLTLSGVLINLGVSWAVQRFYHTPAYSAADRATLVTTGLGQLIVVGCLFVAVMSILQASVVDIATQIEANPTLLLITLFTVLPEQVSQYCMDVTRLKFRAWSFFTLAVIKNLCGFVLGLYLLIGADWGLTGILAGNLVAAWVAAPIGLWLIRSDLTNRISMEYQRMLFRFGAPFVFTAGAYWLFTSSDRWLLARFADATEVGIFSIACKFATPLVLVTSAFHQAWIPTAMRMSHEDPDYLAKFARIAVAWVFAVSFMALGIGLFAREILVLTTPEPYWRAEKSLIVVAIAFALSSTIQISSLGITLQKRTSLIASGTWIAAAVNIGLNLLLIPIMGALGSAIALAVTFACLTGLYWYWSQNLLRMPVDYSRALVGPAILTASLGVLLGTTLDIPTPVVIVMKLGILGAMLYAGFRWRLIALNSSFS